MTTPDFRALCAELAVELENWMDRTDHRPASSVELFDSARNALATPPPELEKSIEEFIAGCKPLDPAMAEVLTPDARWRLYGEDDSLPRRP
jgi:hypothetical protein